MLGLKQKNIDDGIDDDDTVNEMLEKGEEDEGVLFFSEIRQAQAVFLMTATIPVFRRMQLYFVQCRE